MIFKKERDDAWITGISWIIRYCSLVIFREVFFASESPTKRVTGIGVNSNDCSVLCISYEKGKKHTERYYIGVKNRATKNEYSIKK